MTEAEWLNYTDPTQMLEFLRSKVSDRKLRRFGSACSWLISNLLNVKASAQLCVEDRFADGEASAENVIASLKVGLPPHGVLATSLPLIDAPFDYATSTAKIAVHIANQIRPNSKSTQEITSPYSNRATVCEMLRCIFGNPYSGSPFRVLSTFTGVVKLRRTCFIDPRWLTSTVVDLAKAIYVERAFDRLPILADALMDAGCDNDDIIDHCRGDGPHVRGCWVVDLLLGKE